MGNLLYFIALILVIAWVIGYVGYNIGGFMHVLLVIAFVLVIQRVFQGKKAN